MMSPFSRHPREPYAPPLGGPSDEEVAAAEAVLKAREKALKARDANTLVFCAPGGYVTNGPVHCGKTFRVSDAVAIQTQWYVPPHGCTGGDYWCDGEVRLVCPHCGRELRLFDNPELTEIAKRSAKNLIIRKDRAR